MSRFATSLAIAFAIVVLALASARAGELDVLSDERYSGYVRDRLVTLTAEVHAIERISEKFRPRCDRTRPSDSAAGRACEILAASDARREEIETEEHALIEDLAKRYGGVPGWARRADAAFAAALGEPHRSPAAPSPAL